MKRFWTSGTFKELEERRQSIEEQIKNGLEEDKIIEILVK